LRVVDAEDGSNLRIFKVIFRQLTCAATLARRQ
jgi:hypothetical protein